MTIHLAPDKLTSGRAAATLGATLIREALSARGAAAIIVATGASQFELLAALVAEPDLRWDRVTVFHLDEYLGLPLTHPASFRQYLWERFHSRLPLPVRAFHYLDGEAEPTGELARLNALVTAQPIDVAFIGIGENAHLAFNDPPADFTTTAPYHLVTLDEACRRQQLGEGWFPTLAEVPTQALSMTIPQILRARHLIVTVPDARKAEAVRASLEGPVTPAVPASILQTHPATDVFLDEPAAARLSHTPS